jgi:uncharacterized protein
MAKQNDVMGELDRLQDAVPELKGLLLASMDGLPVVHALSNGLEADRIAAAANAASSLGRRITDTTGGGEFSEIGIRGDDDMLFLYSAGSKGVLAVMAPTSSNAGLIHLEARHSARAIRELQ